MLSAAAIGPVSAEKTVSFVYGALPFLFLRPSLLTLFPRGLNLPWKLHIRKRLLLGFALESYQEWGPVSPGSPELALVLGIPLWAASSSRRLLCSVLIFLFSSCLFSVILPQFLLTHLTVSSAACKLLELSRFPRRWTDVWGLF